MGAIAELYRKTRKPKDVFWNVYVCRPPAAVLVYALRSTRITPNQITLAAFGLALFSAGLILWLPGYWGIVLAIFVYELSYVLDCVDGMLARFRGIQSIRGHLLDFLMDEIKAFVILGAVAVRLYLEARNPHFLLVGIGGLVCLASGIALTTFQRRPEIADPRQTDFEFAKRPSLLQRAIRVIEEAAKFLIHYPSYILYAALLGDLRIFFYPYVAVNAVYAARAWLSVALRFGRPEPRT